MEKNNQLAKVSQISEIAKTPNRIEVAKVGKTILSCSDEEIKQAIRYGIMMIGISEDKWGDELSKSVLIKHLRIAYGELSVDELKLSFDFAVEHKTEMELKLFKGEFISSKYIGNIILSYLNFKKKNEIKPKEIKLNNIQRLEGIVRNLDPELKKKFEEIGKPKYVPIDKREKTEHEILIQDIMKEFDQLHRDKPWDPKETVRTVEYLNKNYTQTEFLQMRLEELNQL